MNAFSTETQGSNTFLVYTVQPTDTVDTMSLGMLTNNRIPGLAPTMFTQMDDTKYLKYNISAKVSASQFFTGAVNRKRLLGVFSGIVDAMLSADDYMIDNRTILIDLEYIFADVSTWETVLICLPVVKEEEEPVNLGLFFKNIMFSTQFDQTENTDYVARIISYLNSMPVFSLVDFKGVLDELKKEGKAPAAQKQPQPTPRTNVQQPTVQPQGMQQPAAAANPAQWQQPQAQTPPSQPVQSIPQQSMPLPNPQPAVLPAQPSAIPQGAPSAVPPAMEETAAPAEKGMSLFYLLQHYNKDNAAIYKAQKEQRKAAGKAGKEKPVKEPKEKKEKKKKKESAPPASFAVPGSPSASFAIPGQAGASARPAFNGTPSNMPQMQKPVDAAGASSAPAADPQQASAASFGSAAPYTAPAQPAFSPQAPVYQQPASMPSQSPANFGQTTDLSALISGQTTDLSSLGQQPAAQSVPHLIRVRGQQKIVIDKPVFRIGKEKSYVDCFIGDNTAISRSHANIVCRDGEYYIVDTNSTNHTYVNGGMIQSNTETKLFHGTKIRLANEEFEFRLY